MHFSTRARCINRRSKRNELYRRQDPITVGIILGVFVIIAKAAKLSKSGSNTQSCPSNSPKPVRLTISDSACTGNYNAANIGFYFNQLLEDLFVKFQHIDTGSAAFRAAFSNVNRGSVDATKIQNFSKKIINTAAKRAININIEKCDNTRFGAAYVPSTGDYQLFEQETANRLHQSKGTRPCSSGDGCTGNYNADFIGSYFNRLLRDLQDKFQNIDTGSAEFKAAFPTIAKGSDEAKAVQSCFTTIVEKSSARALNINIENCDSNRLGAAYDPRTGGYQLFGIFNSGKSNNLRTDFKQANTVARKVSYMSGNIIGTMAKLGTILHELTHRYCATNDELGYMSNYAAWKKAPAADLAKTGAAYRVFYELMIS